MITSLQRRKGRAAPEDAGGDVPIDDEVPEHDDHVPEHDDYSDDMGDADLVLYTQGTSSQGKGKGKSKAKGKKKVVENTSWILTDRFSGGPEIPELIPSFLGHVATDIWKGTEVMFNI